MFSVLVQTGMNVTSLDGFGQVWMSLVEYVRVALCCTELRYVALSRAELLS